MNMITTLRQAKADTTGILNAKLRAVPIDELYVLIEGLVANPEKLRTIDSELLGFIACLATLPIVDYLIDVEERNCQAQMN